jgi:hypothetical protein
MSVRQPRRVPGDAAQLADALAADKPAPQAHPGAPRVACRVWADSWVQMMPGSSPTNSADSRWKYVDGFAGPRPCRYIHERLQQCPEQHQLLQKAAALAAAVGKPPPVVNPLEVATARGARPCCAARQTLRAVPILPACLPDLAGAAPPRAGCCCCPSSKSHCCSATQLRRSRSDVVWGPNRDPLSCYGSRIGTQCPIMAVLMSTGGEPGQFQ